MPTHYDLLGIDTQDPDALSPSALKRTYFAKVRAFPPEKFPEEFKKIREAYDTLRDEQKRKKYDATSEIPQELIAQYNDAHELIACGLYQDAIKILEDMVKKCDQPLIAVRRKLIDAYIANHNPRKVTKLCAQISALDPDAEATYLLIMGECYADSGFHNKCDATFCNYFKKYGETATALLAYAKAQFVLGRQEQSLEILRKAQPQEPTDLIICATLFTYHKKEQEVQRTLESVKLCLENCDTPGDVFFVKVVKLWILASRTLPQIIPYTDFLADYLWAKKYKDKAIYGRVLDAFIKDFYADKQIISPFSMIISNKISLLTAQFGETALDCDMKFHEMTAYMEIFSSIKKARKSADYALAKYPMICAMTKDVFTQIVTPECKANILARARRLFDELKTQNDTRKKINPAEMQAVEQFFLHASAGGEPMTRETEKIGRNAPCPCGSGQKHKNCCAKG